MIVCPPSDTVWVSIALSSESLSPRRPRRGTPRTFAYLDLVLVDTPLSDEVLARELASMSEKRKEDFRLREFLRIRIARVRQFLDYLTACDEREIAVSSKQGGPYRDRLSATIQHQLDREIAQINERSSRRPRY